MRYAVRVAALMIAALPACGESTGTGSADRDQVVQIDITRSRFTPDVVVVRRGTPVRFVITNTDPIAHEFIAGDAELHRRHEQGTEPSHSDRPGEVTVAIGRTATTRMTFRNPGEVVFACHLPGHLAYGMRGIIRVR